jgi:bacillithiol biosynthesis cysteine-adding enzyme BshC
MSGTTALFRDFCEGAPETQRSALQRWYPAAPFAMGWAKRAPQLEADHRERLAGALLADAEKFGADEAARASIAKLLQGAAAVVTGQQVGLFGGPLLTLLKAATAIRKAQDATEVSGREHVPVFWLASEDHDLAEIDQVALLTKTEVETLHLGLQVERPVPVGGLPLDGAGTLEATLDRASELLGWGPVAETLRECYAPGETLASGFGKWLNRIFAGTGLVVMDAASREFHALGAPALRGAIEQAGELEAALLARSAELESAGYHAQVLVAPGHSLLFLLDEETGARLPLRRSGDASWKAGQRAFSTAELLAIVDEAPERLSPNALLRPVFQDCILPTAAYVGGPAEVAYFAQSAVVYEHLLGRVTAVLPRLSATLVEPAIASVMAQHEISVPDVWEAKTVDALGLKLGARAMPIAAKRALAATGNAMDTELTALTDYMRGLSEDLGRAAEVSASKMRYQMDRLRRMTAQFELQKEASLRKHATAMVLNLFPDGHPQERVLAGALFAARAGDSLPELLISHAGLECPGHRVLFL